MQTKAINDIDLDEEFLDLTVFLSFTWKDKNLKWTVLDHLDSVAPDRNLFYLNMARTQPPNKKGLSLTKSIHVLKFVVVEKNNIQSQSLTSITVKNEEIWIPQIEIMNRLNEFSPIDEVKRSVKVDFRGKVFFDRMYRFRTMMNTHIQRYPYDIQVSLFKSCKSLNFVFSLLKSS